MTDSFYYFICGGYLILEGIYRRSELKYLSLKSVGSVVFFKDSGEINGLVGGKMNESQRGEKSKVSLFIKKYYYLPILPSPLSE